MTELLAGIALGLGAGVAPGPLLALVLTSTLQRGFGAGLRVAIAPLLTDAPIIALSVLVVSSIPAGAFRALGIAGGIVVVGMGGRTIREARLLHAANGPAGAPSGRDVRRGVLVNLLSPHPWIFWISAGGPLLVAAWRSSVGRGVLLLVGFYSLLVGSKIIIALAVARGRRRLSDRWRRRLLVLGGVMLVIGGSVLGWEAAAGRL